MMLSSLRMCVGIGEKGWRKKGAAGYESRVDGRCGAAGYESRVDDVWQRWHTHPKRVPKNRVCAKQ
jgi:hypothetical protein